MSALTFAELAAIIGAVLGGGAFWTYILSRKKSSAEATEVSVNTALNAMAKTMDTLKARVQELENDNSLLRELLQTQEAKLEERYEEQMENLKEQKEYFQVQLTATQSQMKQAEAECRRIIEIKSHALESRTAELTTATRRLEDYLKRFPQFDEGFDNPRKATAPLSEAPRKTGPLGDALEKIR